MLLHVISFSVLFLKRGARVEAEAAALAVARHPGVVELVGVVDGVLQTRMLDCLPLAELGPLSADEVAGVAAAVGTTLADLHELGVVHGDVDASHVLVCSDGRLVLCSLGRGGAPADDVAALGRLVTGLLSTDPVPAAPGPVAVDAAASDVAAPGPAGAAPGRSRRNATISTDVRPQARRAGTGAASPAFRLGRRSAHARRGRLGTMLAPPAGPALAALAAEATAPDPARRPIARAFATAVHQQVPTARLPALPPRRMLPLPPPAAAGPRRFLRSRSLTADVRSRRPSAGRHPGRLAVAAVVAGAIALAALVSWVRADPGPGAAAVGTRRQSGPATAAVVPTTVTPPVATRVWPEDPLRFVDGVLTIDGVRYAVGQPGDSLVAGDWACTGRRTLALLRPATGELFAFDGWAGTGEDLAARPVGRVAGATGIRAVDADGDGCDDLEVTRPGGPPVRLEVRS